MPTTRLPAALLAAGVSISLAASLAAVAGPAGAASAHHAARSASGHYAITAKVNLTQPVVGQVVKVKGVVTPAAPGQKVQLEVLYANRKQWKTIGSDTLNGRSKYKLTDKIASVRARKYRVVKAASNGRAAGHSKGLKVTSFGWRTLTSIQSTNNSGFFPFSPATINGVAYPNSFETGAAHAGADFNLNRGCTVLQARFGIDDSSPSNATTTLGVAVDGVVKYDGDTFALTQSVEKTIDVTGAFRISLAAAATSGGRAVVASPMVLCNF